MPTNRKPPGRPGLDIWDSVRAEYEVGASQIELAEKFKVSRKAIQNHIKDEGWAKENVSGAISRRAAEKVAKIVAGSDLKKRAAAVDAEADRVALVVERHRAEWSDHAVLVNEAVAKKNFEMAKLAKITAETIMIRQTGERRAWGIEKEGRGEQSLGELLTDMI